MEKEELSDRLSRISTLWTMVLQAHGNESDAVAVAQRVLLQRWLTGRTCLRLLHPYPVDLARLFDALEPRLRS